MKESLIVENIRKRLNIDTLNVMQKATAKFRTPGRMLLLAPTGSGKTIAFVIPFLKSLNESHKGNIQGLVIAPTRELVLQISEVMRRVASGFKTVAFYGGHAMSDEINSLSVCPDIVIATPGRLLDHLQRRTLTIAKTRALVLDEYDKSLDLGFRDEMSRITDRMYKLDTLILTSATQLSEMPDFIDVTDIHTFDFATESEKADAAPTPRLDIARVQSPAVDKLDTLNLLLRDIRKNTDDRIIVFVNHRESAERIANHLRRDKFPCGLYYGGLEQQDRERALLLFNNGTTPVLVATDLASRGLDIADVKAVIHYHLPPTVENWTHRNGRTGRMGAAGQVFVITSDADNIPEYVSCEHDYYPSATATDLQPLASMTATLHFNAGKKEKISRGDIAGFLIQKGGLGRDEVGVIDIRDHFAYAAVPRAKARQTIEAVAPFKLKNQKVRITQVKV